MQLNITEARTLSASNRREVKRFVKFAIVGAAGSITDFTVLNVLVQVFGFPLALANFFSFTAAVIQNFSFNRLWTFPESRGRGRGGQLARFATVSIIGLVINQMVFLSIHHMLEPHWMEWISNPDTAHLISYNFAKLIAIGVVLFWNFFVNRFWTYRGL